jgi:hypothetical protein
VNTLFGKPRGLSDPMVASVPFLRAGKWQILAIVAADNRNQLYCDGKWIQTLPAQEIATLAEDEARSPGQSGLRGK